MALYPAFIMMRKTSIIKLLKKSGAVSLESAKTLDEIGLFLPSILKRVVREMVLEQIIGKTSDNRYYLIKENEI